jgi:hypothetical protein
MNATQKLRYLSFLVERTETPFLITIVVKRSNYSRFQTENSDSRDRDCRSDDNRLQKKIYFWRCKRLIPIANAPNYFPTQSASEAWSRSG